MRARYWALVFSATMLLRLCSTFECRVLRVEGLDELSFSKRQAWLRYACVGVVPIPCRWAPSTRAEHAARHFAVCCTCIFKAHSTTGSLAAGGSTLDPIGERQFKAKERSGVASHDSGPKKRPGSTKRGFCVHVASVVGRSFVDLICCTTALPRCDARLGW